MGVRLVSHSIVNADLMPSNHIREAVHILSHKESAGGWVFREFKPFFLPIFCPHQRQLHSWSVLSIDVKISNKTPA